MAAGPLSQRDLVVVGAGPAGMAAACAAAEVGVSCTLVDEQSEAGGQIYRRFPFTDADPDDHEAGLRRAFDRESRNIEHWSDTLVWGLFPERRLAVVQGEGWRMLQARQLVLATGAHEFVPPFPGWTLPGVMTAGGAQILAKSARGGPGRRALVAGSGPFLLVVAAALQRAGVEVVGVVEAAAGGDFLRPAPGLLARPDLLARGLGYVRDVLGAGIPLHRRHVVVEASGDDQLESVAFAPCDADWRPDRSRLRRVEVDTLAVGFGFVPRTQLLQLAGCGLRFAPEIGGWVPQLDDAQRTTAAGVLAAGDGSGVAGAEAAALEGRIAGLAAAHDLGALDAADFERRRAPALQQLRRLRRFRAGLDRISAPRPGLDELAEATTPCCRCEEVTRADLDAGIRAGARTLRQLKTLTRLGMGPCQGRMCWPAAARYLAARTGVPVEAVGAWSVRPPIRPVSLGVLAEAAGCAEAPPEELAS